MAEADWTYLNDGLDIATVDRGVNAGIARPPGGGSFLYAFNTLRRIRLRRCGSGAPAVRRRLCSAQGSGIIIIVGAARVPHMVNVRRQRDVAGRTVAMTTVEKIPRAASWAAATDPR